jgi:hypothetical protein
MYPDAGHGFLNQRPELFADHGNASSMVATRARDAHFHPKQGERMSTIHLHETTTSTPEQFVAGLTDFGPGRSKLFGNSADDYLKVHDQGPGQADVTEGSGGIWERLH